MTSKILLPLDLSHPEFAADLLKCAADLAKFHDAGLRVIAVVPQIKAEARFYVSDEQHQEVLSSDKAFLQTLVREYLDQEAEIAVVDTRDAIYRAVIDDCSVHECDLIVIGAHRPGFSDFLLGSNAAKIARHAPCDIYIKRS